MSGQPDPSVESWTDVADDRERGATARRADPSAAERPRVVDPDTGAGQGPTAPAGPSAWAGSRSGTPAAAPGEGDAPDGRPAAPGDETAGAPILTDVAALEAERDEYLTALQRLKADFDNYRKRVLRQQEEQAARGAAALVTKLLPVLDNLDLAWAHLGNPTAGAGEVSEEARALAQARSQLLDVLAKEGLERVDRAEVPFDPTVHDAVAHAPAPTPTVAAPGAAPDPASAAAGAEQAGPPPDTDVPARGVPPAHGEPTGQDASGGVEVDEVMRAGYRWRGQVLRPAMVRVRG
jgi:molecular chaperone GrpE